MSLTFRKLVSPTDFIGQCSQLQPNKMQCPKAASYLCSDSENKRSVQYCTFHARCLEDNIPLTESEPLNEQPKSEPTKPTFATKLNLPTK